MSAFELTRTISLFTSPETYIGRQVSVGGWLRSARIGKKVGFLVLSDGSSHETLQVVISLALMEAQPALRSLGAGYSVLVKGTAVASIGSGQTIELQATSIEIAGTVLDPSTYPLQPKAHSPEFLRSLPYLRSRVTQFGAIARLRHCLMRAIHDYLESQQFLWIATPIISGTDAEGAGERFRVSSLAEGQAGADFFDRPAYLTVSGQLEAEAMAQALGRVYTFGPTFRAEQSHTSRHLAEFWMVEPEMAFADLDDVATLAEDLLKCCVRECLVKLPAEMAYFAEQEGGRSLSQWQAFVDLPFARVTYTEAIDLLIASGVDFSFPITGWGADLQSEHEKWLVERTGRPVVVTDYPSDIKAFYMRESDDGRTVKAMDILVPGMGEIVGGSQREERHQVLLDKMLARGMDASELKEYVDLRAMGGGCGSAGFGLGFERLVAFLGSQTSIKDVIAYPRTAGSL